MSEKPNGNDDIRPPIEELSDVAWARVERGLLSRIDTSGTPIVAAPPSRRWLWIAAPTAIAAAVVGVVLVSTLGGGAVREITTTEAEPLRVVTSDAPTSASFGDAHITLDANTAVAMRNDGGNQPTTLLERGVARFTVAPRANRPPFVVRAGDTTVRVIGTKFRVARSEERVEVSVEHGIVDVQFRGTIVEVREHQAWTSERPTEVTPVPAVTAAAKPAANLADPTPEVEPVEDPEIEMPDTEAPARPAKRPARRPVATKPHPEPALEAEPKPAVAATGQRDAEQSKFNQLQAIEKRDPDKAIAGYLELSQQSGRWAAVGLYAAGRLAADRRDPRAETLLTIYLRRFPTGRNVDDARRILARLKGDPR